MTTVLTAVRTVKTPTLPRDDEDVDLAAADAAVFASAENRRPVNMRSGVDAFRCSPELARLIASGRI
jgi:hypothetical protein